MEEKDKTFLIRIINLLQIIGCVIGAIFAWSSEAIALGFVILVSGMVIFAILKAIQDIVETLDSIDNKLKK